MSDLIFKGEVSAIKELMKRSREHGMQTFDQALFDLFEGYYISKADALRNADSVNDLRLQIKLNSMRERNGPGDGSTTPGGLGILPQDDKSPRPAAPFAKNDLKIV